MCSSDHSAVREMDTNALGEDFIEQDSYNVPFQTVPPGEEGVGASHAGGEYEAFHSFAEDLAKLTGPLSDLNYCLLTDLLSTRLDIG